jgi:hypothetical protein
VPRVRSMGGRLMPPVRVRVQRLSAGLRAANLRSMRGPSALRAMRTSTSAQASAGMTLVFEPPPARPTLTVRPRLRSVQSADFFDNASHFADGAGSFFKVDAGVGGDAGDVDAPVAGAFAGGFVGQALGWFEDVDGGTFGGQRLGDGAGDGAAYFLVAVEEQDDFVLEKAGFGEHFDGGEGHGDAGFHVEGAGTPEAAFGDAAGHGFEGAEGPDGVEMTEEEDGL